MARLPSFLLIAMAAYTLPTARPDNCTHLRKVQSWAREEVMAHGLVLQRRLLDQGDAIPETVNATLLGDILFNTYFFTANFTWEIFEEDCTTFVTTGDIPQMWLRDSSVQMSTYVQHAGVLPNVSAVLQSVITRQVRFFLGDPYGSAFYRSSGPKMETTVPTAKSAHLRSRVPIVLACSARHSARHSRTSMITSSTALFSCSYSSTSTGKAPQLQHHTF